MRKWRRKKDYKIVYPIDHIKIKNEELRSILNEVYIKCTEGVFEKELQAWEPNYIKYIAQTTIRVWEKNKSRKKFLQDMQD